MKTHFIFNHSVLMRLNVISLIAALIKHRFPVFIISDQLSTQALVRTVDQSLPQNKGLTCIGSDQALHLKELYLQAGNVGELQYLTVAFDDTAEGIQAVKSAGFYLIDMRQSALKKIFRRLKINAVHQLQYLPEIKKIKSFMAHKMGYPVSILQCLHGDFTDSGVFLNSKSTKLVESSFLGLGNFNYYINNPGDPFVFSKSFIGHSCIFEQDVIRMLGHYYGLPPAQARGFITSGGTEGNFTGLWWARDYFKDPETVIYFSTASHYSITKVAWQLGLKSHPIASDAMEAMDVSALTAAIKLHMRNHPQLPMIISVNAGTTKMGAIDDILSIKKMLDVEVTSRGGRYLMHLDAACLGAVIPLIQPFGASIRNYFDDLGISTIAISAHKFFGMTDICGVILTTHRFLMESAHREGMEIDYIGQIHDITPSGSRSGNYVLQLHNLLYQLDFHTDLLNLKKILAQCWENCDYLYRRLCHFFAPKDVLWLKNSFCLIFPRPSEYLIKKYSLMPISPDKVGVYGLVNLDKPLVDLFLKDLNRAD
jgi:histidine decarboxylase